MATDYREFNRKLVEDFHAHDGEITSGPLAGHKLLILTTRGARTGELRETPLGHVKDGDNYAVIALNMGAPHHPGWLHNLRANPSATVEVMGEKFEARPREADGEEYARIHAAFAERITNLAEYEAKTTRRIPIVVLERVD